MKFSIKDFFSKCDQIRSFLPIWSHLLNKSLMENFIFLCCEKIDKKRLTKTSKVFLTFLSVCYDNALLSLSPSLRFSSSCEKMKRNWFSLLYTCPMIFIFQNGLTVHKKWNFPLRTFLVNVTNSAENCKFGHIYWRNP